VTNRLITGTQVRVSVSEQSDIGECRRTAKRLADGLQFGEVSAGRAGIVATELATNIVRHARSGEILVQSITDGVRAEVEVLAVDRGPGMADFDACLRDGYSTGGTAGQGLGAVSRLSGVFDAYSHPAHGTVVMSRIERDAPERPDARRTKAPQFEFGVVNLAVEGEIECGDTWRISDRGSRITLMVADGLGHGPLAAAAAQSAASAFAERPADAPAAALEQMHRILSGSRGAAVACADLRPQDLKIDYAGVGNISGAVVAAERSRGMVSHNGTLGVKLLRNQQFEYEWPKGSLVVMHSDGLSARWNLAVYPGLHVHHHPGVIAGVLYRDFVRRRDDATVVVASFRHD
jgi:anti-sigma regulatory factor (Ser/Thr protein kinase)